MRVLITGGAGYIGTALTHRLALQNEISEIIIYDNLSRQNHNFFYGEKFPNSHKIKFVHGELLDSRNLKKNLKGMDTVYHLAAKVITPFANVDPHFFEQVNHWGTAELVYALEDSNVRNVIYTSSTSVYGAADKEFSVADIPNPRTFYGISKMRGEEHIKRLAEKLSVHIFRCGNVFGFNRSMRFDAVINRFMFDAHFNRRISIHGDGKQRRAFIHIDRVAKALAHAALGNIEPDIYNLVDHNSQVLDIVDVLKEIYPDLEFLFINQHLNLRELRVARDERLFEKMNWLTNPRNLKEDLLKFKEQFSF